MTLVRSVDEEEPHPSLALRATGTSERPHGVSLVNGKSTHAWSSRGGARSHDLLELSEPARCGSSC